MKRFGSLLAREERNEENLLNLEFIIGQFKNETQSSSRKALLADMSVELSTQAKVCVQNQI